jgi:ABC-type dipeptide/oligopeptide/nickel transport system permease component
VLRYVLRRLGFAIVQLLAAVVAIFLLLRALPTDPASTIVGVDPSPQAIRQARHTLGLDHSTLSQLGTFLTGLLHGSLGHSWQTGNSVNSEILAKFPVTLQFVVPAFVLAIAVGVPIGLYVATRPGGRLDGTLTGYSLFAGAQPDFWWGLMFLYVLYFVFPIFPAPLGVLDPGATPPPTYTHFILIDSLVSGDFSAFTSAASHFALPVFTLAFVISGPIIKMTRESAAEVYGSEFVLYARACGMPPSVIRRRTLSVAVAPVITLVGILFGFMLGGAVLTETVFSLDGLGRYALNATLNLNYPSIQGSVIVLTAAALLIYLCMDLLHAFLDPRATLR